MKFVRLRRSRNPAKKWDVILSDDKDNGKEYIIAFGARGMSDFTKHGDTDRRQRYLDRHRPREDWTATGLLTPGFWSRWLLWNQPTLEESLAQVVRRFRL